MRYEPCSKCGNPLQGLSVYYTGTVHSVKACVYDPGHSLEGGLLTATEAVMYERDQVRSAWQQALKQQG